MKNKGEAINRLEGSAYRDRAAAEKAIHCIGTHFLTMITFRRMGKRHTIYIKGLA